MSAPAYVASCIWGAAIAVLFALCSAKGLAAGKPAIVIPPSVQALSPSEVEFGVRVDEAESAPAASVVLISGLPPDVTFSAGRAIVRGTWEVPLGAIAGLKVKVPADIKGRSDLVILLTHNSEKYTVVLASARSALVVDAAPGRAEPGAVGQIGDMRKQAETRKAEEEQQIAQAKRAEEAKKAEEARKLAEARKAEEARKLVEAQRAEEERRIAQAKRAEEARLAEEAKKAEEARKLAEAKRAEETRLAEEAKKAEEARKLAEAKRAEEERRIAEAKRAEEARLEEAKKAEEARKLAEARKAEEERSIAEAKRAEESLRVAEATKVADERSPPAQRTAEGSRAVAALDQRPSIKEPTPSLAQDRLDQLITQGDRHLVNGNVVVARQYYLRAAQAGMARAALRLAETYDPNELRRLNVQGLMPDVAEAKRWYERAVALGDAGAQVKLGRLNGK
ncbi:MAG TPA: hypothetical protein VN523_04710 [Hyphomicrobiaceae bacterium]|nr:hypothetical protein [Hyphomicrobiaceae bacterium]